MALSRQIKWYFVGISRLVFPRGLSGSLRGADEDGLLGEPWIGVGRAHWFTLSLPLSRAGSPDKTVK